MEKWRDVWRNGIAPHLSTAALEAMLRGIERDDPLLIQGSTTYPPLLEALKDRDVEACCPIGFAGWQGEGLKTLGEIEVYFQKTCDAADATFHEPASCRFFLNWVDDTPREKMRLELAIELRYALSKRTKENDHASRSPEQGQEKAVLGPLGGGDQERLA